MKTRFNDKLVIIVGGSQWESINDRGNLFPRTDSALYGNCNSDLSKIVYTRDSHAYAIYIDIQWCM